MTTASREQLEQARQFMRLASDPVLFARTIYGEDMHPKQEEMLRAVRDHPRVSVVGANGTGKDFTTGRLIPWWLNARRPSIVVIIGPTHRQVRDIVWQEVRTARAHAEERTYTFTGNALKTPHWELGEQWFATGFATVDPYNIQGYHSENLLVIVTEAHNVADSHFDAINRLNPTRLLLTGNPFSVGGRFYDSHHSRRADWYTISISAFDTPNVQTKSHVLPGLVTWEQVEWLRSEYGEDNPFYRCGVLGEWAIQAPDTLLGLNEVMAATRRQLCARCGQPPGEAHDRDCIAPPPFPVLGVDVARYGDDSTVVYRRDGPISQMLLRRRGLDTQEVAAWVRRYCMDNPAEGHIVVDEVGLGAGVYDTLRHNPPGQWVPVAFNGGSQAYDNSRYRNRNAEVWWTLRERFLDGDIVIPDDRALIAQLTSRKYKIQSDARITLESKDELRRQGMPSPDEADALAMTFGVGVSQGVSGATQQSIFTLPSGRGESRPWLGSQGISRWRTE